LSAQEVIQSEEINIRNHLSYHIIGQIEDVLLLYQDKGYEREIVSFDKDMVKLSARTPSFEKKKAFVLDLSSKSDSVFHIIYGYKDKAEDILRINTYNKLVEIVDSTLISASESVQYYAPYQTTFSDDQSKIAIYKIYNNEEIKLIIYDIVNKETLIDETYELKGALLEQDLMQTLLSNNGEFWLLFEHHNNRNKKENHFIEVYTIKSQYADMDHFVISLSNVLSTDLFLSYDDVGKRLGLFGLYSEKSYESADGFFYLNERVDQIQNSSVHFVKISDNIISDLYGKDARSKENIDNFVVADVVWRADGGVLMILEMSFDYYRRPNYSSFEQTDNYRPRSWTNHLNEDMIMFSISPESKLEWSKVMYKRQRSQDDQGIYSSFFTFRTPSRLRVLFNDEIKSNNTVSEYILDSYGRFKRNSLLSTEYQNLRLRIKDAVQISSTELLVPSQRSGFLSLVKIDYRITN
jgi:hypothetical protein